MVVQNNFDVEFFQLSDGTSPVEQFLLSQDHKMRAKVLRNLGLLQQLGNKLREPYSKHLGDGIFEIRTQVGNNISRVLYFFVVDKKIILTNGFVKKAQKTPDNEIEKAKQYRREFMNR